MIENVSTDRTQRIMMHGRTYIFVNTRHPELDGHDNLCIGHLLNSRHLFAGYVFVMVRTGARVLQNGPSGVSREQERTGLAMIYFSGPLQALISARRTKLLAMEALTAAGVPFTDRGPSGPIRILLPGWGDIEPGRAVNTATGQVDPILLRAMDKAKVTIGRDQFEARDAWAQVARRAVATDHRLTDHERATLHEAAEILKGKPEILTTWAEAARP